MCGITGFAGQLGELNEDVLCRMNEAIRRRGPDDGGHFLDRGVGLAMRRLSILDLEMSHQPMANEDESIWVVFNGEIYNFKALRRQLLERGHVFRTAGDTEVLVHLYEEYGRDMVKHLRGMFAFAIWDRRRDSLFIARDRLGIKPLFYAMHQGALLFGSELKCILQARVVPTELDWQAIDAFFALNYIPAPLTIYQNIFKLPPGHFAVFENDRLTTEQYWDIDFQGREEVSIEDWEIRVEEKLKDAVESHLVSDVPLGAFLSGGVDSSLVVGMMSEALQEPVTTFTMGFGGQELGIRDERPFARMLQDRYDIDYNEFTVQPDLRDILDELVEAFDEPFGDDAVVPTYYISQLTRRKVKVALSGLGADELFAGYHRHQGLLLSEYYDKVPGLIRSRVIDPVLQALPEPHGSNRVDHIKRFSRFSCLPADQRYLGYVTALDVSARRRLYAQPGLVDFDATGRIITDPFNRCPSNDVMDRALYTDLKTYLPDDVLALSDRLSMWHSLELRVPLIDHELAELAAQIPSRHKIRPGKTKLVMKRVAARWLPEELLRQRKQGFASPMNAWLKSDLRDFARDALWDPEMVDTGLFNRDEVEKLYDDHQAGRSNNEKALFCLLFLYRWMKKSIL